MLGIVAALVFGYLLGSIPFGLLITRAAGLGDIRSIGSGNIGATNVLRTGRKGLAAATLIGDALKGTVAVLLVYWYYGRGFEYFAHELALPAALGALLGHLFPVWLGFKGGKGVATYLGICLALAWPVGLLVAGTWLAMALLWRISSLSALIAIALSPAYFLAFRHHAYSAMALGLSLLIFWMHRENIRRLLKGTEPRIGAK